MANTMENPPDGLLFWANKGGMSCQLIHYTHEEHDTFFKPHGGNQPDFNVDIDPGYTNRYIEYLFNRITIDIIDNNRYNVRSM